MPASQGGGAGAPVWVPVPGVHVPSHRCRAPCRQHCPPSVSSFSFSLSRVHQPHHRSLAPRPVHLKVNMLLKTNLLGTCAWCPSPPPPQTRVLGVFPRRPWESVFYFCMEFLSVTPTYLLTCASSASSPPGWRPPCCRDLVCFVPHVPPCPSSVRHVCELRVKTRGTGPGWEAGEGFPREWSSTRVTWPGHSTCQGPVAHWVHPSEDREGLGLAWATQSAWGGPGASNHREVHVAWYVSRG